jgi:hypothetical protein
MQQRLKNRQGSLNKPVAGELKHKSHQSKDVSIELDAVTCQMQTKQISDERKASKQHRK